LIYQTAGENMIKITFLDAATLGEDLDLSPVLRLGDATVYDSTSKEEIKDRAAKTNVIVANKVALNEETLSKAKNLKLICVTATGFDNVDLPYCRKNGIAVCNVAGYSANSVCQVTVAMALSLYTHLPEYSRFVGNGLYSKSMVANRLEPVYREIAGKTWGVLGYGSIGKKVAAAAIALGCVVLNCSKTKGGYDIDTLCRFSDIISVHIPLNNDTKNLLNKDKISLMKKGVVLINTSRGGVTDESAIAGAVRSGKIGAFGCDVYTQEPFGEQHPFYGIKNLDNVCLTPHMAWGALESRERLVLEVAENIAAFLAGERRSRLD